MDINVFRGVILVILMVAFAGLWVWAWSSKRKHAFHEASLLPLEEDDGKAPGYSGPDDVSRTDGKGSESC